MARSGKGRDQVHDRTTVHVSLVQWDQASGLGYRAGVCEQECDSDRVVCGRVDVCYEWDFGVCIRAEEGFAGGRVIMAE